MNGSFRPGSITGADPARLSSAHGRETTGERETGGMAAWMFKGNPTVFDIDTHLASTNPIWWTVGAPVKDPILVPGDRVYMFRADGGPNRTGGVVAVGRAL